MPARIIVLYHPSQLSYKKLAYLDQQSQRLKLAGRTKRGRKLQLVHPEEKS